ncbi:MAG TPA: hypothetical protein VG125_18855 [Pirellulales bacterium]|jgi:hypothetical protein|nr:hypothetical protein [Pirellulales bacterium]
MFLNRISHHVATIQESPAPKTAFALVTAPCASPAVSAIYRDAYLQAFATVEQRVIRRRKVRAARFVSWN